MEDRAFVSIPYHERDKAKAIPGARWHPDRKQWSIPAIHLSMFSSSQQTATSGRLLPALPESLTFKHPLFEHQRNIVAALLAYPSYAVYAEMGLGKTACPICAVDALRQQGEKPRALVYCPKTLLYIWAEEIEKFSNLSCAVIEGTARKREQQWAAETDFTIVNYDLAAKAPAGIAERFNVVVLDESQKIKNHQADRTRAILKQFRGHQGRRWILSGTPITQNFMDIYCQFYFLDPSFLGFPSWYAMRGRHCQMGGYQNYSIVGYRHVEELEQKIKVHSVQLKKEDVKDLTFPDRQYEKRILEMSAELAGQYKQMREDLILELQDTTITASIVLTKILRLQEILGGHFVPEKDNAKMAALRELLSENLQGKKVVIWCRFIKSIGIVENLCKDLSLPYVILSGDTEDRSAVIKEFQQGKAQIFIGQVQTGGLGITLTAADTAIFYENSYNFQDRKQAEDRIHRIGQEAKVCTYLDLVYKGSVDERVLKALAKKSDLAADIVASFKKGDYSL